MWPPENGHHEVWYLNLVEDESFTRHAAPATKDKHLPGERVLTERRLRERRQTVHALISYFTERDRSFGVIVTGGEMLHE